MLSPTQFLTILTQTPILKTQPKERYAHIQAHTTTTTNGKHKKKQENILQETKQVSELKSDMTQS